MKAVSVALACAAAFALTACDDPNHPDRPDVEKSTATVSKLTFKDGTKCYLNHVVDGADLSCDFTQTTTSHDGMEDTIQKYGAIHEFRTADGDICVSYNSVDAVGIDCKFN